MLFLQGPKGDPGPVVCMNGIVFRLGPYLHLGNWAKMPRLPGAQASVNIRANEQASRVPAVLFLRCISSDTVTALEICLLPSVCFKNFPVI